MKRLLSIILVLTLSAFCLFAADYYIRDYEVFVEIGSNGVHHIEEFITVVFEGEHDGIVREIPLDYRDYNGKTIAGVKNIFCSEDYTAGYDDGYLVLHIGDADKTASGRVDYTIAYDYDMGADCSEDYDEIYLNLVGTKWECPIDFAVFHVFIPYVRQEEWKEFYDFLNHVADNTYMTCGYYGSTSFDWERGDVYLNEGMDDDGSLMIDGYVEHLKPHEGITIRIDMPEGWYQGARAADDYTGVMTEDSFQTASPAALHGDVPGLLFSVLLIAVCFCLSVAVAKIGQKRLGEARSEVARKIVHIGVSNWFFIYAHVFENDIWPIVGLVSFALINAGLNISGGLSRLMAQESTKRNWGLVLYPFSIILLIIIRKLGFGDICAFGCAVLGMGYGDGLASLAGRHVRSPKLWKESKKTVAGSITMAAVTFVVVLIMKITYGNAGTETALLSAAVCSVAATLVEAITPFGLDNISVPLSIYLIAGML